MNASSGALFEIKADLLSLGTADVREVLPEKAPESHAGPSTCKGQSVFFCDGKTRVRLALSKDSPAVIVNTGDSAKLIFGDKVIPGYLEKAPCHCPNQAYITVTEGCMYACKYCSVPYLEPHRKTKEEIISLIERSARETKIECISLTSGVVGSPEAEAEYLYELLPSLEVFGLPVGVSVYPVSGMVQKLKNLGVSEVKFNLEAATKELFEVMCPGLDRDFIFDSLVSSVEAFGKNHVYTNIILGLGETDLEMKNCIRECISKGIIPVIRPLTPSAELSHFKTPEAKRIKDIAEFLKSELELGGLDSSRALSMCAKCKGCDLSPDDIRD